MTCLCFICSYTYHYIKQQQQQQKKNSKKNLFKKTTLFSLSLHIAYSTTDIHNIVIQSEPREPLDIDHINIIHTCVVTNNISYTTTEQTIRNVFKKYDKITQKRHPQNIGPLQISHYV